MRSCVVSFHGSPRYRTAVLCDRDKISKQLAAQSLQQISFSEKQRWYRV